MTRIIGISGSLRDASLNSALLRAAAASAPSGVEIEIASIHGIPLFNEDVERADFPVAVSAIKEKLATADGLLIATPEYNHSMPGVLKNAIDWISRPPADIPRVLRGLPVALLGASPGGAGTELAQNSWLPVVRTLGLRPWFEMPFTLARAPAAFGPGGVLVDTAAQERIRQFVAGFAVFARRSGRTIGRQAELPVAIARTA